MLNQDRIEKIKGQGRKIDPAEPGDEDLGPLQHLPGTWKNLPNLPGRGWNMIALPFAGGQFNYRLLVNQYNEELQFSFVDKGIPNRGISRNGGTVESDQFLVALDYQQKVKQISADDFPQSGEAGGNNQDIHHEPGLFLHMTNETTNGLDIARLATIPHGNSALALGKGEELNGAPRIPAVNGLPIGVDQNLGNPDDPDDNGNPYLAPYRHFHENLFEGLFDPVEPHKLLVAANAGLNIAKTTTLELDTAVETGGIVNIPFIEKQANAADMKSTFWIQELAEKDEQGNPKLRLQYLQVVVLDFFPRRDGLPGPIRWPHVSINTMEKVPSDGNS